MDCLGIIEGDRGGKYLGMFFMMDRTKKQIFQFLKDRVAKKVKG